MGMFPTITSTYHFAWLPVSDYEGRWLWWEPYWVETHEHRLTTKERDVFVVHQRDY